MRLTNRSNGAAAHHRAGGLAIAAVLLTGLLVPLSAGAEPDAGSAVDRAGSTAAADAVAAAAAADDLVGDITFSVPSGTFQGQVSVSLGTTVSGAQVRYTTDGRLPTAQSTPYQGTPLTFTRTTQLRAQAFVGQTASGAPGTAMYTARAAATTSHDLPVVVIDSYGAGRPQREYFDATTMIFQPGAGGTTSLAATPAVATRAGFRLRGQIGRAHV